MIDVAHDRDDRGPGDLIFRATFFLLLIESQLRFRRNQCDLKPALVCNFGGDFEIQRLVDGRHDAERHEIQNDIVRRALHFFSQVTNRVA